MRELLAKLSRLQRATMFKIVASGVVLSLAIARLLVYFLFTGADAGAAIDNAQALPDESLELIQNVLQTSDPTSLVLLGTFIGAVVSLVIVWLGLALTYLALAAIATLVAVPLMLNPGTEPYGNAVLGAVILTFSFTALLQLLRLLFSLPGRVPAIAKNVLSEAVRLKLSLVFIVMLVLAIAAIPELLQSDQPLRYRVQSFLQYSTGGSFWIIALLTLFFSAATVSFEQRDKVIWQTMTKPVAPWEYILGKWLGVVGLVGVLLLVSSSGVFLSTEYLRRQTAVGESIPYQSDTGQVTEDRLVLETQVLSARRSVGITIPFSIDDDEFTQAVEARMEAERQVRDTTDEVGTTAADRAKIRSDVYKETVAQFRTIAPGRSARYEFEGLAAARASGLPITLRYRVDAEGNRPDRSYRISFILPDGAIIVREIYLGFTHTIPLSPDYIDSQGRLFLEVANGQLLPDRGGLAIATMNEDGERQNSMTFPSGGLEISYVAGSYHMNFLRVMLVLWLKLAFLSMVAIFAATFLSFPVACLVAVGVFLMGEGAAFIFSSVELYSVKDQKGNLVVGRAIIASIAYAVSSLFRTYADLRPTGRLVEGRLLSWGDVARGVMILGAVSAVLYALAVAIFRRRELAIYSGH